MSTISTSSRLIGVGAGLASRAMFTVASLRAIASAGGPQAATLLQEADRLDEWVQKWTTADRADRGVADVDS